MGNGNFKISSLDEQKQLVETKQTQLVNLILEKYGSNLISRYDTEKLSTLTDIISKFESKEIHISFLHEIKRIDSLYLQLKGLDARFFEHFKEYLALCEKVENIIKNPGTDVFQNSKIVVPAFAFFFIILGYGLIFEKKWKQLISK